ncbi:MAG: hypothetical protein M3373_08815 [Gemmatimonadota bacterium]|nr:hypothetical protein [Gemmatimonadota bacterium]
MRPSLARAAVLGMILLAAACSADSALAPELPAVSIETSVVATASGHSTANDVLFLQAISYELGGSGMSASVQGANGPSLSVTYGGLNCAFDAGRQRHVCPQIVLDSMTLSAEYALYADDAVQTAYDDVSTDSAEIWYSAAGRLVNPDGAADIGRTRTLKVRGLSGTETQRIFGGSGVTRAEGIISGIPLKTYVLNDTTTATDVVYGVPFISNVWPKSGTLETRSQLDVSNGLTTTTTHRRVTITFSGTQTADMDVDGVAYSLDLASGAVARKP